MERERTMDGYFRQLEQELSCPAEARREFLKDAQRRAGELLQEHPEATAQELEEFLGSPQDLAQFFMARLEPEALHRYEKKKKQKKKITIALTAACILIMGFLLIRALTFHRTLEVAERITIYPEVEMK